MEFLVNYLVLVLIWMLILNALQINIVIRFMHHEDYAFEDKAVNESKQW